MSSLCYDVKQGSIIRNVTVVKKVHHKTGDVYIYYPFPKTKGILFPNDDIIFLHRNYDVIINSMRERRGLVLSSGVYHQLSVGKVLPVVISHTSKREQPMFLIHGYTGFVIGAQGLTQKRVCVRVIGIKKRKYQPSILETKIESFISSE